MQDGHSGVGSTLGGSGKSRLVSLVDETLKYLKGKQVVVVTDLESDGYLQEIVGILLDGVEGCLVVQQGEEESPTLINAAHVAWIYEETVDEEEEEE